MNRAVISRALVCCGALVAASTAWAIPMLQVGAPAGDGDTGLYADYTVNPDPPPTETDTAITFGNTIYVGGAFGPNTVALGGSDAPNDWGDIDSDYALFNTHDAILMLSFYTDDQQAADDLYANMTVNGSYAFLFSDPPPTFPNNHDPLLQASHYLYFDIGDFTNTGLVPNFVDESGAAAGEIKTLTLAGGFETYVDWIHFDVMAIETDVLGNRHIMSTYDITNNPGGHDVTWKAGAEGPSGVPVPGTLLLVGLGLVGLAHSGRRRAWRW